MSPNKVGCQHPQAHPHLSPHTSPPGPLPSLVTVGVLWHQVLRPTPTQPAPHPPQISLPPVTPTGSLTPRPLLLPVSSRCTFLPSTPRLHRAGVGCECLNPTQNGAQSLRSLCPHLWPGRGCLHEPRCWLLCVPPTPGQRAVGLQAQMPVGPVCSGRTFLLQDVGVQGCYQDAPRPLLRPPALGAPGHPPCPAAGGHRAGHLREKQLPRYRGTGAGCG